MLLKNNIIILCVSNKIYLLFHLIVIMGLNILKRSMFEQNLSVNFYINRHSLYLNHQVRALELVTTEKEKIYKMKVNNVGSTSTVCFTMNHEPIFYRIDLRSE